MDATLDDGRWDSQTRRHIELIELIRKSNIPFNASILDVGCGSRMLIERLGRHGYRNMHGCDWVDTNFPFDYKRVDLNAEGLSAYADKFFDVAICSDVIEHLENPAMMLRELKRVVRPGGDIFNNYS